MGDEQHRAYSQQAGDVGLVVAQDLLKQLRKRISLIILLGIGKR